MISKENYDETHIREIQASSRKDPVLVERALYAMGLLEALSETGMKFVFKGGSSLMLLLPHVMRLSTDIDIIVPIGTDVVAFIKEASTIFPFESYEEQVRIGKNNIEKRHFKFTYFSPINDKPFYILLDILFEDNNYETLVEREIKNELLLTEGKNLKVRVPSIDCILGDKLTAFAPYTTGIPLRQNKNLEVMKQFYDIWTLTSNAKEFNDVLRTFKRVAKSEISYRGLGINPDDVLEDIIQSCVVIASRGKVGKEDYASYLEGIRGVATHIIRERFSGEIASYQAADLIYYAASLLTETPFEKVDHFEDYSEEPLSQPDIKVLSKMRKAEPLHYAYLVKADRLLSEYRK